MTIPAQTAYVQYVGNGVTTVLPIPFMFDSDSDIYAEVRDVTTNTVTVLTAADYTLSGAGDTAGGSMTYTPALSASEIITIRRNMPYTQTLALEQEGGLVLDDLEEAFDASVKMIQQLDAVMDVKLLDMEQEGIAAASSAAAAARSASLAAASADEAASFAGFRDFDNYAAMIASALTYSGSGASTVSAGDIIRLRDTGFIYEVAASGASNHHLITTGGGNVKLYVQPVNGAYDVQAFGADPTGATDAYAAITKAISAVPVGGSLRMDGTFATSATIGISTVRVQLVGNPTFIPYGSFSDYLVELGKFGGGDTLVPDLAYKSAFQKITVDGKLQARGIKCTQLYNSALYDIAVFRSLGTAIKFRGCMEDGIVNMLISGCKRRVAGWVGTQTAWNSGTSYDLGDYVYVSYPIYNAGTAYAANDFVNYGGEAFRAKQATTGNTPGPESIYWEWVPWEYFKCLIAHSNKDPHAGSPYNTTRSGTVGNRYWQQVFVQEPALDINSADHPYASNNLSFYGLWIRHCDHSPLVRVDSNVADYTVTDINFIGGQVHQILPEYISAYDAGPYTPSPGGQIMPTRGILLEVGSVINLNVIGGNWRSGKNSYCKSVQLGHKNPGKTLQGLGFIGVSFSGDYSPVYLMGDWQIGMSVMPSYTGTALKISEVLFRINGSNSINMVDPGIALRHKQDFGDNYNNGRIIINENDNPSITLGRSGEAGTPNIPIISSGLAAYDSRLRGSGGTATSGTGNANIDAATLNILYAGTSQSFKVQGVASGVNYVTLTGTVTGSPPSVKAEGADTNLDLLLQGKGSGVVRFGSHSALATETLSGYITVKDAAGNVRKLAVVSEGGNMDANGKKVVTGVNPGRERGLART